MVDAISNRVKQLAREDQLADGTPCRTRSVSRVAQLAEEAQVSGRRVEIIALEKGIGLMGMNKEDIPFLCKLDGMD